MAQVTVRYWAGAREAAGLDEEVLAADAVGDLVQQLAHRTPGPRRGAQREFVARRRADLATVPGARDGETVEVLPPFAGG